MKKRKKREHVGGYGKFAPKFTHEQRCGFYYAFMNGDATREVIEAAMGVNRGTVTRLLDPKYKAYNRIHYAYRSMGHDSFGASYMNSDIESALAAGRATLDVHSPTVYDSPRPSVRHDPAPGRAVAPRTQQGRDDQ